MQRVFCVFQPFFFPFGFVYKHELFERADFVKFAKFTASDEDNAAVLPMAVKFVTSTYQADVEREEKKEVNDVL